MDNCSSDRFTHQLDDGLRTQFWTFLSWTERHRASSVNKPWKLFHASVADELVEADWHALVQKREQQRRTRRQTRETLSPHEAERLDWQLHDTVTQLLEDLGSTANEHFIDTRPRPNGNIDNMNKAPHKNSCSKQNFQTIQQLLDKGASDTYFNEESNQYGYHAVNLSDLFDRTLWGDPPRVDHYISMHVREGRHSKHPMDEIAWDLVQEMGYSAGEKWPLCDSSDGFKRFHCLLLNHWVVPYGRVDRHSWYRLDWRLPSLAGRENVFKTFCLVTKESREIDIQWYFLFDTLSDLLKDTTFGHEVEREEPHCKFRHSFFLRLFYKLVVIPEIKWIGSRTPTSHVASWFLALTKCEIYWLVWVKFEPLGPTGYSFLRRLDWDAVFRKFHSTKEQHRLWRLKMRQDRAFRLVAMEMTWPFVLRRKDRETLLDIWVRLEPCPSERLLPEWLAMVESRSVKGKKERLQKELVIVQEALAAKRQVVADVVGSSHTLRDLTQVYRL